MEFYHPNFVSLTEGHKWVHNKECLLLYSSQIIKIVKEKMNEKVNNGYNLLVGATKNK